MDVISEVAGALATAEGLIKLSEVFKLWTVLGSDS